MASSKRSVLSALFLLALLLLTFGGVEKAEARVCSAPSRRFKGLCFSDRNCASICRTEGFSNGDCHGFRRRCFCLKPCPAEN